MVERLTGSQEVRGFESLRLHPKVLVEGITASELVAHWSILTTNVTTSGQSGGAKPPAKARRRLRPPVADVDELEQRVSVTLNRLRALQPGRAQYPGTSTVGRDIHRRRWQRKQASQALGPGTGSCRVSRQAYTR